MKHTLFYISLFAIALPLSPANANETSIQKLLSIYANQNVTQANKSEGKKLWEKEFNPQSSNQARSCAMCHTKDLSLIGKHIRTNKPIAPMSPIVNNKRFTKVKKIEKWFKRNCKWTLGRECSAQEKANVIAYIFNTNEFKF